MKKGILAVISGFSGAGKGTVIKELMERHEGYALSVSATTRAPRPGEEHGREYFFLEKEAFEEMIENDQLLEHACYVDHYYGTPRPFVEEKLSRGMDVLLEIELQGALQIRERYPEAVLIFITPPSIRELKNRLTGRGSESAQVIENRLKRARVEAKSMDQYDYLLVNDTVSECAEELHQTIRSIHRRASLQGERIREIQRQAEEEL